MVTLIIGCVMSLIAGFVICYLFTEAGKNKAYEEGYQRGIERGLAEGNRKEFLRGVDAGKRVESLRNMG